MKSTLTTPEAARRLGVHPGTLRRWRQEDDKRHDGLETVPEGRAIHYTVESVEAYVRARLRRGEAA